MRYYEKTDYEIRDVSDGNGGTRKTVVKKLSHRTLIQWIATALTIISIIFGAGLFYGKLQAESAEQDSLQLDVKTIEAKLDTALIDSIGDQYVQNEMLEEILKIINPAGAKEIIANAKKKRDKLVKQMKQKLTDNPE